MIPELSTVQSVLARGRTCWVGWGRSRRGLCPGGRTVAPCVQRRTPASSGSGAPPGQAGREPALSWTDSGPECSTPRPWRGERTVEVSRAGPTYCGYRLDTFRLIIILQTRLSRLQANVTTRFWRMETRLSTNITTRLQANLTFQRWKARLQSPTVPESSKSPVLDILG